MKEYRRISAICGDNLDAKMARMVKNRWQLSPGCYQVIEYYSFEETTSIILSSVIMEREIPEPSLPQQLKQPHRPKQPAKITANKTPKGKQK